MGQVATSSVILERGLRATFIRTLEGTAPHPLTALATFIPSTVLEEKYGALGDVPQLTEFTDTKIAKGLLDRNYTLKNKRYEATMKMSKDAVKFDQTGDAMVKIAEMTTRAKLFPGKLISDAIINGTSSTLGLGYDATAFFSNSHPAEGSSGTTDNLLGGAGSSSANIITDVRQAVQYFRSVLDTSGEPLNDGIPLDLVAVIPPALEGVFQEVQNAAIISQTSNVVANTFRTITDGRMTDTNDWYMFNVAGAIKPFILQEADPVKFVALLDDSDATFMTGYYIYGVEWMGRVGYGYYQKACKIVN